MIDSAAIEEKLKSTLKKYGPNGLLQEIYLYAVLPAGKLFRPRLVLCLGQDLNINHNENLSLLACSIEIHHAYTLVHDDLPDLDNDDVRRGKQTVHKKFGSWQAILAGDGLLNMSFHLLSNLQTQNLQQILRLYSWATGPKGLILGQTMDMNKEGNLSWERLLRIHELKTGRLFQIAFAGTALLSNKNTDPQFLKTMLRLGTNLGISFQLIDDVLDLIEQPENTHELEINPFLIYNEGPKQLEKSLAIINKILIDYNLEHTKNEIQNYLELASRKMTTHQAQLIKIIGERPLTEIKKLMS